MSRHSGRSRRLLEDRFAQNFYDQPPLVLADRPAFLDENTVADGTDVLRVMGLESVSTPDELMVFRILNEPLDLDDDSLFHLVAQNLADACFSI